MPPRKIYGKSRSNYDPLSVFDSPQRPAKPILKSKVATLAQKVGGSAVRGADQRPEIEVARRALGDLNVNCVHQTNLPANKITKPQSSRRIVVEDSEDEEDRIDSEREPLRSSQKPCRVENETLLGNVFDHDTSESSVKHKPLASQANKAVEEHRSPIERIIGQSVDADSEGRNEPSDNEYTRHCSELLELSSHGIATYTDWSEQLSIHFDITKIAEASFSEVYRLSLLQEYSDLTSSDESVFKVIPLQPPNLQPNAKRKKGGQSAMRQHEGLSSPEDLANEVKLLSRMNEVPGFTNFRDIRVVQGRPPQPFVKAYKSFNAQQKKGRKDLSIFPDPSKKTSYPEDQLWAVIEMQDAGTDLEQLVEADTCASIFLIWDVFWQTVLSLAKGEEAAEFEHRDLHLGNICVRMPSQHSQQCDVKRKINFTSVETTIIDYTISRARMADNAVAYHNLTAESGIFDGDSTEEYQYDIYRYMRGAVLANDPYSDFSGKCSTQPEEERSWKQYHPISNLIWLHFILYKLLEQVDWPSARKQPPKRQKEEYKQWKRGNDLEHILLRVSKLLDVDRICQSLIESASDLVGLALREGWLDEEDVLGREDSSSLAERFEGLDV